MAEVVGPEGLEARRLDGRPSVPGAPGIGTEAPPSVLGEHQVVRPSSRQPGHVFDEDLGDERGIGTVRFPALVLRALKSS